MLAAPPHRAAPDPDPLLSVTTLPRLHPGYVEVSGELDTRTAPVVEACLRSQAVQRGVRELVVDLTKVTFLGAADRVVIDPSHDHLGRSPRTTPRPRPPVRWSPPRPSRRVCG